MAKIKNKKKNKRVKFFENGSFINQLLKAFHNENTKKETKT